MSMLHLDLMHLGTLNHLLLVLVAANPNPPEPAAPIGIGASLPPLSPKQGGKDPSIVWQHFIKLHVLIPIILGLNASIVKININVMVRKMVHRTCCNT